MAELHYPDPTPEEICGIGWNSPEHDNPVLTDRLQLQQGSYVCMLLHDLRELEIARVERDELLRQTIRAGFVNLGLTIIALAAGFAIGGLL